MSEEQIFTVTQVNNYVKHVLSLEEVLVGINMEGEVQDFKISGPHAYFTLKDEGAELRCTLFGAASHTYRPKNGDKVVVTGKIDFYIKRGQISFNVARIKPYGLGDMYQRFLELKAKLEKLGYFDQKHKKPIPGYPKRIGVVTSEKGAVIRDIINVTRRRNANVDIVLYPVRVQGDGAEREVMAGIEYFNECEDIDTIIIARGGGSIEDLAPFYTEVLALKVFDSDKPIISAIGHDTDYALTDFVADMRAPTPSAAAELAVPDQAQMIGNIKFYSDKLYTLTARKYMEERRTFRSLANTVALKTENVLNLSKSRIEGTMTRMANAAQARLTAQEALVAENLAHISRSAEANVTAREHLYEKLSGTLSNLNPLALLNKGYAKVSHRGREILSIADVKINSEISVRITDGTILAKVTDKKELKKKK